MAVTRSTTGVALMGEIQADMANWNINLSLSQRNAFLAHIEGIINSNSSTALADIAADLNLWPEPAHGRHS